MTLTTSLQKGNLLEEAVRLIETTILNNDPVSKVATVIIEPKKVVVVDDVKHEIDLFVTIDFGKGYKSTFIFECKNWEESVGKNEIIVFSEKIDVVQAQKGYFIAKSFGKYAIAQAQRDKRIELLQATDDLDILTPLVNNFHIIHENVLQADLSLRQPVHQSQMVGSRRITNTSRFRFQRKKSTLREFSEYIQKTIKDEVMGHEPTGTFSEGTTYTYDKNKTFLFQRGELFIDGKEYIQLDAHVIWEVQIMHPKIVSNFDIKTRGKVITLEKCELPTGGNIIASFIDIY